jgi:S-(hydroxymethyl)glutathione dehydrogenase/alcohol dehydrogenase
MRVRAAVLWKAGEPLSVETVDLAPPGPGEVLVAVEVAGVCHSDLHAVRGDWPVRGPLVPGHEGAGVVREIGAGVTRVRPGQHVVFCWAPPCGQCASCVGGRPGLCSRIDRVTLRHRLPGGGTRLRANGIELAPFLGTACFATHTVLPEEALVVVPFEVPFAVLASVGCAVVTGLGAVTNAARVPAGAVVAVIGAGGVGLNVVQGAVLARCSRIIAVDRQVGALAMAAAMGATDTVQATRSTAVAIRALTGGCGVDFAFDTVGTSATLTDAIAATAKGGTIVVTGLSGFDALAQVPISRFVLDQKRLQGSLYGSGDPRRDIEDVVAWHQQGRVRLGDLATRSYRLDEVNAALEALAAGEAGRGILTPNAAVVAADVRVPA